ncbi:hypothetical protein V8F20_002721 [Naviculisporaceae sp. PSN 640]
MASIPPNLGATLRRYQHQYKQDTDYVASWLAATARASGYPAHRLTTVDLQNQAGASITPSSAQPTKRLKGKARKLAVQKSLAAPAAATTPPTVTKKIVAIRDFVPLAEWIASREPEVPVPDSLASVLNRVIHLRTAYGEMLPVRIAEDAKSHAYFVGVLEKVRASLKPRMSAKAFEAATAPIATDGRLENIFALLSLHEPTGEDLVPVPGPTPAAYPTPVSKTGEAQTGPELVYEAETMRAQAATDALTAYIAMFFELKTIREQVMLIWENVKAGELDTSAAALATNTALEMARELMEDPVTVQGFNGFDVFRLCEAYHVAMCLTKGFTETEAGEGTTTYEVADATFVNVTRSLASYLEAMPLGSRLFSYMLPHMSPKEFGDCRPHHDRAQLSNAEKYNIDSLLLAQIFNELSAVCQFPNYPVEDELTRLRGALNEPLESSDSCKGAPFALVFAAQIFLDIHHILGKKASDVFVLNMCQMNTMRKGITEALKVLKGVSMGGWRASEAEQELKALGDNIEMIFNDPIAGMRKFTSQKAYHFLPSGYPKNHLLRLSPILSGLLLYRFRDLYYQAGIGAITSLASTTASWHLYNALKTEELLEPNWDDMDAAAEFLGGRNLHIGDRPSNRGQYFKSLILQMGGGSVLLRANLPAGSRAIARFTPKGLTRKLHEMVPVSRLLSPRYEVRERVKSLTVEHLDEALQPWREEWKAGWAPLSARPDRHGRFSWVVGSLAIALNSETTHLVFPWLAMEASCWSFVRELRTAIMEDLSVQEVAYYTDMYCKEAEMDLPFIVAEVLRDRPQSMKRMEIAAGVMRRFVQKQGGKIVDGYKSRTTLECR